MGKMNMFGKLAAVGVCMMLASQARAEFVISVQDAPGTGNSSVTVAPGQDFSVFVNLASDSAEEFESFGFDLAMSGLPLGRRSYELSAPPFVTGGVNDFSDIGTLHFEGLADNAGDVFGDGALVTLNLTAGTDAGTTTIDALPDFLAAGFFTFDSVAGQQFTVNVTPEPATLMLLGIGGVAALRRRRRTA